MSARLTPEATAVVDDPAEASQVYAKGFFGEPRGSSLTLDRYETTYLVEMGRLTVTNGRSRPVGFPSVFRRAHARERGFAVRYLVYRDLRQRGYVVRPSPPPTAFAVLPRGGTLNKTPARFWVQPYSERDPVDLGALTALVDRVQGARKTLLAAVVDEESDLTFYRIKRATPSGSSKPLTLPSPTVGWLGDDRIAVLDPTAVESLGKELAYGSRVGSRLEVSLLEGLDLVARGQLELKEARTGRPVARAHLERRSAKLDRRAELRLRAYRALRERGLIVKTGFKYGAHFRAYQRRPDHAHARYLIEVAPADARASWPELAGAVRVTQGVRKEFLLALVEGETVRFLSLERIRP